MAGMPIALASAPGDGAEFGWHYENGFRCFFQIENSYCFPGYKISILLQ
jgi:hypothetical protein